MGARLYDPTTGRFLQVDPDFEGSCNAYDYVCQDPLNATDLGGTCFLGKSGGPFGIWGKPCLSKTQKIAEALQESKTAAERNPKANAEIIKSIRAALNCLAGVGGSDLPGIGSCLAAGGASSIAQEIDGEVGRGVAFDLDPLGSLIGELIDLFTCAAQTFTNVGYGMGPHVVIKTGQAPACDGGVVVLPTRG